MTPGSGGCSSLTTSRPSWAWRPAYDLLSLGSVQDAAAAVSKPGPDADTIAAADIVLVTVGGNQALPDPETGIGCTTWFLKAQGPCLEEGVATYGDLYDQVFAGVKALRGDEADGVRPDDELQRQHRVTRRRP